MRWFLAKIIFRIVCGDGMHTPQYDEQLRLISATDKEEAFHKANQIGKQEEETFFNQNQQLVSWQYINVSEIFPLNKIMDGAELYSRVTEEESAELYEFIIHKKSKNLFSIEVPELFQEK